jgi:hypothetical protein
LAINLGRVRQPTVIIWKRAGWLFAPSEEPEAKGGTKLHVAGNTHERTAGEAIGIKRQPFAFVAEIDLTRNERRWEDMRSGWCVLVIMLAAVDVVVCHLACLRVWRPVLYVLVATVNRITDRMARPVIYQRSPTSALPNPNPPAGNRWSHRITLPHVAPRLYRVQRRPAIPPSDL